MPSWQARLFDKLITALVRRRSWGDPERLKFRARRIFGPPPWYSSTRTFGVKVRRTDGTLPGEWIVPDGSSSDNVILYFHGGGYVSCSPRTHRPITAALARDTGCRVLALDYRLAPEHQFPMAFTQTLAAYHWLLMHGTKPTSIVLAGDSAGGGLTLALLAALREREPGSLPSCAVAFSPWTDLEATGAVAQGERRTLRHVSHREHRRVRRRLPRRRIAARPASVATVTRISPDFRPSCCT